MAAQVLASALQHARRSWTRLKSLAIGSQTGRWPSILPGDVAGARAATERLIQAGRRRIGIVNGQDGLDNPRDRLRGYEQALASNDIAGGLKSDHDQLKVECEIIERESV